MRALSIALLLSTTLAFAQLGAPTQPATGFQRTFTLGAQSYGPALSGHFNGVQDGKSFDVDLKSDLGLGKDKSTPGFFLDYQGPRFGFQVTSGAAEYRGNQMVNRNVTLDGTTYPVGTQVRSHMKLATVDGTWTIKLATEANAWIGLDLGAQVWTVDMDAADSSGARLANTQVKAPIPQIGLSGGSRGYNGAVESKLYYHYLAYKKAKYTLYGLDLRIFPVRWFGLRAFYEAGKLDVPKGSLKDDLELQLDRKGLGFGAVLRF